MSFPAYDTYKDSGDELLGRIPFGWEVWKVAHAFTQIGSGTTPKSDKHEYYDEGTIPWVNTGDLNDGPFVDCAKKITEKTIEDHSTLKLHPEGSLLFAMYGATIGKLGLLRFPATVNQACCVFSGESPIEKKFLFYWFLGLRQRILSLATGGGQPNVSQDILRTLRVACPDVDEQKAISSFLDVETSKIDGLVSEQRRVIELLKEKRQAVISHAVTKGLNPNAPMKPSGIQWLGDVPEHWDVGPLKRFWSITDCKHITAEFVDEGIPLASIREVQSKWVERSQAKQTTQEFYDLLIEAGRKPQVGDLIFSRNATVGEVAQVGEHTPTFAMGQDVCLLRKLASLFSADFWQHLIESTPVTEQMNVLMVGATFKRINVDEIRNLSVLAPPPEEQEEIASYLNQEVETFSQLQVEAERAIELLQERRTALISAAVTGKIDVREFAPVSGKALAAGDMRTNPSEQNRRLAPCRSRDRTE